MKSRMNQSKNVYLLIMMIAQPTIHTHLGNPSLFEGTFCGISLGGFNLYLAALALLEILDCEADVLSVS